LAQAYDWAFSNPVRKVYYNLTVTGLSVAVELFMGTVELLQVATSGLDLGGALGFLQKLDFGCLGYAVVGNVRGGVGRLLPGVEARMGRRAGGAALAAEDKDLGSKQRR